MNKRKIYIDMLKVLAILGVIYNHTAGQLVDSNVIGFMYITSLIIFFFSKIAVSLFIMISGANLMNKEDSTKKMLYRILRFLIVLFVFSFIYIVYFDKEVPTITEYIYYLFTGTSAYSLWYLYMYIGLMVMLPIIREFKLSRKKSLYLFSLYILISTGIPFILNYFGNEIEMSEYFTTTFLSGYIVCFILGDFLDNKSDDLYTGKNLGIVLAVMVIDIIVSLMCVIYEIKNTGSSALYTLYDTECTVTTFILAACTFFVFRYFFKERKMPEKFIAVIRYLSDCVFGVYLIHFILIFIFNDFFSQLKTDLNILLAILVFDLFIYLISVAIISAVRLIPGIKKLFLTVQGNENF